MGGLWSPTAWSVLHREVVHIGEAQGLGTGAPVWTNTLGGLPGPWHSCLLLAPRPALPSQAHCHGAVGLCGRSLVPPSHAVLLQAPTSEQGLSGPAGQSIPLTAPVWPRCTRCTHAS